MKTRILVVMVVAVLAFIWSDAAVEANAKRPQDQYTSGRNRTSTPPKEEKPNKSKKAKKSKKDKKEVTKKGADGYFNIGANPQDSGRAAREGKVAIPWPRDEIGITIKSGKGGKTLVRGNLRQGTPIVMKWVEKYKLWCGDYIGTCGNDIVDDICLSYDPNAVAGGTKPTAAPPPGQQPPPESQPAPSRPPVSATPAQSPVSGVCGPFNGATFNASPPVNDKSKWCSAGDLSSIATLVDGYKWNCLGQSGGSSVACSAGYVSQQQAKVELEKRCFGWGTAGSFFGSMSMAVGGFLTGTAPQVGIPLLIAGAGMSGAALFSDDDPRCRALGALAGGVAGIGVGLATKDIFKEEPPHPTGPSAPPPSGPSAPPPGQQGTVPTTPISGPPSNTSGGPMPTLVATPPGQPPVFTTPVVQPGGVVYSNTNQGGYYYGGYNSSSTVPAATPPPGNLAPSIGWTGSTYGSGTTAPISTAPPAGSFGGNIYVPAPSVNSGPAPLPSFH